MKNLLNKSTAVIAIVTLLSGWITLTPTMVSANASYNAPTVQTATATSSPVYMTPGTATSTLTYDSQSNPTVNRFRADFATLAIRFSGVSPAAVLTISPEYSNDCVDYYRSYVIDPFTPATATSSIVIATKTTYSMNMASSTVGGTAVTTANSATSTAMIMLPTPTRCTRVVMTITGANGAVWAQIAPIKQQ